MISSATRSSITTIVSRKTRSRIARPRESSASAPSASAVSVDTAAPQPTAPSPPALMARNTIAAPAIPPRPARTGTAIRERSRSSPTSSSRLASSPTTRKNSVISPSLTHPWRSVSNAWSPSEIARFVSHSDV